eukprot:CAMPEP_0172490302 /NCGR_PEP_ID=MMETSP1066-20121228/20666_1 /TAXON_ID=671091 /ORGANISM="Coscinodiscus wailesii, Strain CCMP2513" /LENGTH=204 /DNA_ID=CAMNT_0013258699 /DNA_START=207 /DNA_END=821 /DNA_ORIENTATION=+
MIKHVVGKVRTSSYCLPEDDFVFGIANKFDMEGAGQVIQSWATSIPSQPQTTMQSFPATNREALKNGCLTAKEQRKFAMDYPVMKQNPKSTHHQDHHQHHQQQQPQHHHHLLQHTFGIKSVANDVPMTQLLRRTRNDEEVDYPDQSHMKKKGRLPPAKSTKASRLRQELIEPVSEVEAAVAKAKAEFKMSKFLKVESKVKALRA